MNQPEAYRERQARVRRAMEADPNLHTRAIICCTSCQELVGSKAFAIIWNPALLQAQVACEECAQAPGRNKRALFVREVYEYRVTNGAVRSAAAHAEPDHQHRDETALVATG